MLSQHMACYFILGNLIFDWWDLGQKPKESVTQSLSDLPDDSHH